MEMARTTGTVMNGPHWLVGFPMVAVAVGDDELDMERPLPMTLFGTGGQLSPPSR